MAGAIHEEARDHLGGPPVARQQFLQGVGHAQAGIRAHGLGVVGVAVAEAVAAAVCAARLVARPRF